MKTSPTTAIVGASGFVGQALGKHLVSSSTGDVKLYSRGGGAICGHPVSPIPVEVFELHGVDVLVHLAGIAHPQATEAQYNSVNVELALNTAKLAHAAGVRRFIFASSLLVHGRCSDTPISPDSPYGATCLYGRSKTQAEIRLREFAASSGLDLVILRAPLIYGPNSKGNFALLVRAAKRGMPLPLGRAVERRSMVSLLNLCDLVSTLANQPFGDPGSTVVLPADETDITVRQTYLELCRAAGGRAMALNIPAGLMRLALVAINRREAYESLFKPLTIERSHWDRVGWFPPHPNRSGIRAAID